MGLTRRRALNLLAVAAAGRVGAAAAQAADAAWPARPIRLLLPNAPGSSIDTVGRAVAIHLGQALAQSVFAENRTGGAGIVGMDAGRNATADGYTFIVASTSSMTVSPLVNKATPFDVMRDFEFVSLVALLPSIVAVNPGLKINSVAELIAYARANPGKVNMASGGIGSISHLGGMRFALAAGFESLHVPYSGGGPSVASVVAGQTHWTLVPAPAAMGLVKQGRLKALAHSMARGAGIEGLPSLSESVPGFESNGWIGIVAPKGVAPAIIERFRAALAAAMRSSALEQALASNGAVAAPSTPAEFRAMLARDIEQTRAVMRVAGISAE